MEGLTPGRMVHYVIENGAHRPAVVVNVEGTDSGTVELFVMLSLNDTPEGLPYSTVFGIEPSAEPTIGYWHWIERA